jgi:hypothetical protein
MAAVTQWFDPTVKPEHEGVYQRDYIGKVAYARYVNRLWRMNGDTPEVADRQIKISGLQELPWRGLADKPA